MFGRFWSVLLSSYSIKHNPLISEVTSAFVHQNYFENILRVHFFSESDYHYYRHCVVNRDVYAYCMWYSSRWSIWIFSKMLIIIGPVLCNVYSKKKKIFEEVKTITQRITTIDSSILHTSEISNLYFLKFIREKIKYNMIKITNLTAFH